MTESVYHVGEVIQGRFEVRGRGMAGRLGDVYRAHDREIEVDVALKVIHQRLLADDRERSELVERMQHARVLSHPNLARVYGALVDKGRALLALQYAPGVTLETLVGMRTSASAASDARYRWAEARPVLGQIAAGLGHAHSQGIVLGDLRLGGVVVLPDGVKITSVGVGLALPRAAFLGAVERGGERLPPEVRAGGPCDARTDVYAFAALAVELLTAALPRPGIQLSGFGAPSFTQAIERALDEQRDRRFSTVEALWNELDRSAPGAVPRPRTLPSISAVPPAGPSPPAELPPLREVTQRVDEEELRRLAGEVAAIMETTRRVDAGELEDLRLATAGHERVPKELLDDDSDLDLELRDGARKPDITVRGKRLSASELLGPTRTGDPHATEVGRPRFLPGPLNTPITLPDLPTPPSRRATPEVDPADASVTLPVMLLEEDQVPTAPISITPEPEPGPPRLPPPPAEEEFVTFEVPLVDADPAKRDRPMGGRPGAGASAAAALFSRDREDPVVTFAESTPTPLPPAVPFFATEPSSMEPASSRSVVDAAAAPAPTPAAVVAQRATRPPPVPPSVGSSPGGTLPPPVPSSHVAPPSIPPSKAAPSTTPSTPATATGDPPAAFEKPAQAPPTLPSLPADPSRATPPQAGSPKTSSAQLGSLRAPSAPASPPTGGAAPSGPAVEALSRGGGAAPAASPTGAAAEGRLPPLPAAPTREAAGGGSPSTISAPPATRTTAPSLPTVAAARPGSSPAPFGQASIAGPAPVAAGPSAPPLSLDPPPGAAPRLDDPPSLPPPPPAGASASAAGAPGSARASAHPRTSSSLFVLAGAFALALALLAVAVGLLYRARGKLAIPLLRPAPVTAPLSPTPPSAAPLAPAPVVAQPVAAQPVVAHPVPALPPTGPAPRPSSAAPGGSSANDLPRVAAPATDESDRSCAAGQRLVDDKRSYCIDLYEYPGQGVVPRTDVALTEAAELCRARGGRLCSELEWEHACRGPGGASYPYGTTYNSARCNTHDDAPVASGSLADCKSGVGAFDMSGNVAEWTAAGLIKGGAAGEGDPAGRCSHHVRSTGAAQAKVGFRCCSDPR